MGASSPQPKILESGCCSCVLPLLSEPQIGGQGRGWVKRGREGSAKHCHSHRFPLSSLLEPPELQHHVTWDLPGRGGGGGPCFFLTSCPPLPCASREGVRSQRKIPLYFFFYVLFFVFLREVIFYSGFIPKEKHKPKKPARISLNSPPFLPASEKLRICLKTKEGAEERGCFYKASFLLFCPARHPHPGDPVTWCLRGRCGVCSASLQGRRAEPRPWAGPHRSTTPSRGSSACPPPPLPSPGVTRFSQVPAAFASSVCYLDKRWE